MEQFVVGSEEAGCRIDRILRKKLKLLPLSVIYMLIRKGEVLVNGKRSEQNYRLQEGDIVQIKVNESEIFTEENRDDKELLIQLTDTSFFKNNFFILYEDENILACNKPAGLVVHPGTGHNKRHDSLIELATAYLLKEGKISYPGQAALIHRLDRDTSGVILIGKNKRTIRRLHSQFMERSVLKEYIVICHNKPPEIEGEISLNLRKVYDKNRGTKMLVGEEGEESKSKYRVNFTNNNISNVSVFLETGKTHQIRVHFAHIGAPIVGDRRYGNSQLDEALSKKIKMRLFLHSYRIRFTHPETGKEIQIEAPIPSVFKKIIELES